MVPSYALNVISDKFYVPLHSLFETLEDWGICSK